MPSQQSDDIREQAVWNVDARHGYAIEYASDQDTRRAEYDEEETRLRAATALTGKDERA